MMTRIAVLALVLAVSGLALATAVEATPAHEAVKCFKTGKSDSMEPTVCRTLHDANPDTWPCACDPKPDPW